MEDRLLEFSLEWQNLKRANVEVELEQQQSITLIKREVIDMAEKFDEIHSLVKSQSSILKQLLKNQDEIFRE